MSAFSILTCLIRSPVNKDNLGFLSLWSLLNKCDCILLVHVLTYLRLYTLPVYKCIGCQQQVSKCLRSWASSSFSPQLHPTSSKSAMKLHLQEFFNLPLFLLPCGFHVRACLVMLDVGFRACGQSNLIAFSLFPI